MRTGWEHFEHQADVGIRGYGGTMAEAFEQAALALTAVVTPPERVVPERRIVIRCEAPDRELLLADWLNAMVREMSALKSVFSRFEVVIEEDHLVGTLWGETLDPKRHEPAVEVKGASYLGLRVAEDDQGTWVAQCVVDV